MAKLRDLTGQQFGKLIVIERAANNGKHVAWLCQCSCGAQKIIQSNHLCDHSVLSCGNCSKSHSSRLYRSVWNKIFQRCYNANSKDYKNYGARGIRVCEEWNDYITFRNWALNNGYDEQSEYGKCTLDRIDVNGNYEPSNCRFVDTITQCRNKRNNHNVTFNGETKTIAEWAEITRISASALYNRFNRGWSAERAFSQKVRQRGGDLAW